MLPTLKTTRLMLKPRTMNNFGSCLEMDKDTEVTEYIPGVWNGSEKHIAFLRERISKSYPLGLGYWSIFSKDDPTDFLGWVHLLPSPDDEGATEIGWRLKRSAWSNGYATEAAQVRSNPC
ncbi:MULTISPECIES: GNAT family N-acetyltransferase [Parabacteroides]|uniref:GNAT family N-acetyltransferase n=1 Tax=Parabacteroides leei TaxID=2939491 RepID=UPI001E2D1C2A|nr:GNAT family N-acetyltransferase [Parabacteroides goldsteinii]